MIPLLPTLSVLFHITVVRCLQPSLPYTAPELVGGCLDSSDVSLSGAADCFSLAALTYQLLTGKQVLPVGSSTGEYRSRLSMLASADMSGIAGNMQVRARAKQIPHDDTHHTAYNWCLTGSCSQI